jgi:hypothetical protein
VRIERFVGRRLRSLAIPALALLGTWTALGIIVGNLFDAQWIGKAVELVVSPLWFIAVYLILVALLPVALWLHERFDTLVLVWLAGIAMCVDIGRFRYDLVWLGWVNMVVVWGLAHQLGFFYERIVAAVRRLDWVLMFVGLFGLVGLVGSGLYPGSMVGVPGERSNMAPPTLCIVALLFFQAGVAELARPWVTDRLSRPGAWRRTTEVMTRFALPLFLFHTTGMALSRAIQYALRGEVNEATRPDLGWWLERPLSIIGPLLCTLPVIYLFGRRWTRTPAPDTAPTDSPRT